MGHALRPPRAGNSASGHAACPLMMTSRCGGTRRDTQRDADVHAHNQQVAAGEVRDGQQRDNVGA